MPAHYYVSGIDFAKLPKQVAVKIHGLQSFVGFVLQHIEYDWLITSFLLLEDVN
jgi:hypothetical protein